MHTVATIWICFLFLKSSTNTVAEVNHFTHVAFACSNSSFLFALNSPSFLDAFLGKYLHLFH